MADFLDTSSQRQIEKLYKKTGGYALSKTMYLIGRRNIAEEIVQDVFLKLWKKKLVFESEEQAYYWIYKSCHNAGIDYLRSKAHTAVDHVEYIDESSSDAKPVDRLEERQFLHAVLKSLNDKESRILAYRVIDGMTQSEIAEIMNVSRKTIVRAQSTIDNKLIKIRKEISWL